MPEEGSSPGSFKLIRSAVSGNKAATSGGGAFSYYSGELVDSTVSGNHAADGGGVRSGFLVVDGSEVTGNVATANGGGITGPASLIDAVVSGNKAGAGCGAEFMWSTKAWSSKGARSQETTR